MVDVPFQRRTPGETARALAERIRADRLRLAWKQETLAERSGVSLATVRRYERTGRTSVENLLKLCHALGRLDEFDKLLTLPPASSIAELEARDGATGAKGRRRGVR